jgi:hypothetical protein
LEEESTQLNNHKVIRRKKQNTSFNDELDEFIAHHYIAIPQIDKPEEESPPRRRKEAQRGPTTAPSEIRGFETCRLSQAEPDSGRAQTLGFPVYTDEFLEIE